MNEGKIDLGNYFFNNNFEVQCRVPDRVPYPTVRLAMKYVCKLNPKCILLVVIQIVEGRALPQAIMKMKRD